MEISRYQDSLAKELAILKTRDEVYGWHDFAAWLADEGRYGDSAEALFVDRKGKS